MPLGDDFGGAVGHTPSVLSPPAVGFQPAKSSPMLGVKTMLPALRSDVDVSRSDGRRAASPHTAMDRDRHRDSLLLRHARRRNPSSTAWHLRPSTHSRGQAYPERCLAGICRPLIGPIAMNTYFARRIRAVLRTGASSGIVRRPGGATRGYCRAAGPQRLRRVPAAGRRQVLVGQPITRQAGP